VRDVLTKTIEGLGEAFTQFKNLNQQQVDQIKAQIRELETVQARGEYVRPARDGSTGLSPEIRAAINEWGRTGDPGARQRFTIQAAHSVGEDPKGGFTVSPELAGEIYTVERAVDPMMVEAQIEPVTKDAWEQIQDRGNLAATGWVGEIAGRPETATADFGMQRVPNHELYTAPRATQKVLDDSDFNLSDYIVRKTGQAFGEQGGIAFITGDGVTKPRGVTTYPTAATSDATRAWGTLEHVPSGAAGAFAATNPADPLIDLAQRPKAQYRAGAKWQLNSKTFATVRKLKDGQGNYLVEPDMRDGLSYRLLGYPVVENEFMPDIAANSLSIAFGNWKRGYVITDRSLTLLRDPYTAKPYVVFYSVRRIGGDVRDFNALKFLKFAVA
jgi:HK97 family phage major capsid protein